MSLENIPADEEASIQRLSKLQMLFMRRDETKRGQHPKGHATVRATFQVASGIPAQLKVGVFAAEKNFDCILRFSNGGSFDDRDNDARGLGMKFLGVEGARLFDDGGDSQDFLLVNSQNFFCRSVADLVSFMDAQIKARGAPPEEWLAAHSHEAQRINAFITPATKSPLQEQYYSTTPYQLGDVAVKYSLRPIAGNGPATLPGTAENFLRQAITDGLKQEAKFEFLAQQSTGDSEPVEDPTIEWKTPFVVLGTLTIPAQAVSDTLNEFGELRLGFNPWNGLTVHKPLGGINRARKSVYQASLAKRRTKTGVGAEDPKAADIPK